MQPERKIRIIRLTILGFCALFFAGTFFILQQREDSLSRYPYGTPEQREQLKAQLDSDEINVLINSQIQPEQVLPFTGTPGFEIGNTLWYSSALQAQEADPGFIVDFVNRYKNRYDPATLSLVLSWMSYADLISYFESGNPLPIAASPEEGLLVLDGTQTLWKWRPSDLALIGQGILLKEEAAASWNEMVSAASQDQVSLEPVSGLIPYDQQPYQTVYSSYPQGPYGTWEEQLGTVVHVRGFDAWNAALSGMDPAALDVQAAKAGLEEQDQKAMDWLQENAWKYGWIIRYDQSASRPWQPFVLRFVGKEAAAEMHDQNLNLEQYAAQKGTS